MKLLPLGALLALLLAVALASANYVTPPVASPSGAAVNSPHQPTAPQTTAPRNTLNAPPLHAPTSGGEQSAQMNPPTSTAPTNAQHLPLDGLLPPDFSDEGRARRAARYLVTQRLWNAWIAITGARTAQGKTTPPCNLILLNADEQGRAYRRDIEALFPQGRSHLPNVLQPRQYFCTTPDCSRRVQYFGKNRQDGFTFIVFRWAQTGENLLAEDTPTP